jgi:hypothetical protein
MPQPFFALFFRYSLMFLPRKPQASILPCSWNHRCTPPYLAYLLRWGHANFFPWLASNQDPPNLHLSSSWDYRCEPPPLAIIDWLFHQKIQLSMPEFPICQQGNSPADPKCSPPVCTHFRFWSVFPGFSDNSSITLVKQGNTGSRKTYL